MCEGGPGVTSLFEPVFLSVANTLETHESYLPARPLIQGANPGKGREGLGLGYSIGRSTSLDSRPDKYSDFS